MKSKTASGFRIFSADETFADAFPTVLEILRERRGVVLADRMDSPKRKRFIMKAELAGTTVVIKRELFIFRFDRSLKALLFGSDAVSIFECSRRAELRGFKEIPRFFLAAERFEKGILREAISVMEFLDGEDLSNQTPAREDLTEMRDLLARAHDAGVISGDVHAGNFLRTRDGFKLIDFRGRKVFPGIAKARDRICFKNCFGMDVPADRTGRFFEALFRATLWLRNLGRRLRGLKPLAG